MKTLLPVLIIILNLIFTQIASSTEFDELDKPPEGAHEGQILIGAFVTLGLPYGDLIDAENNFLKGSTKTFDNDISKSFEVSHWAYSLGISFEYMPVNHFGAGLRFKRTYIVQNTNFGSEYENWKGYLYRDYSFIFAPAIHATTRKTWDFVFTPLLGYSIAKVNATPVAKKILVKKNTPPPDDKYSGDTARNSKGFCFGANLNCTIYFTGGLYISLGGEWLRQQINLNKGFDLTNPQTGRKYSAKTSSTLDIYSIIIAAGYAFSN